MEQGLWFWVMKPFGEAIGGFILAALVILVAFVGAWVYDCMAKHGWTARSKRLDQRIINRLPKSGAPLSTIAVMMDVMNLTDPNHRRDFNRAIKRLHKRGVLREEVLIRYGESGHYLSLVSDEQIQDAA